MTRPGAAVAAGAPAWPADPDWLAPPVATPPVALYVHLPFCASLCPYCDFVVLTGADARGPRALVDRYLAALRSELGLRADALDHAWGPPGTRGRPALASLYLGGGTPSLLPARAIAALADLVRSRFGLAAGAEVTLEANPDRDGRGDAGAWREAGVTRISYGAQSLDPAALRRLGRRHAAGDVAAAVTEARAAGIVSVGLDLLLDVPDQSLGAWTASLEAALALEPDHVSVYALALDDPDAEGLTGPGGDHLPLRAGARRWRAAARAAQDEDRAAEAYRLADERLAAAGFVGYELSNWARHGAESRHNLVYWTTRSWEALGVGAHAFDGATRRWNAAAPGPYLAALVPGDGRPALPPGGSIALDRTAIVADRLILGLRLRRGVPRALAECAPLRGVAPWALEQGLLEAAGQRLRLTMRGRLLSNEVFARLL